MTIKFPKLNTEKVVGYTTKRLVNDITELSNKKENALSSFRETAMELGKINESLEDKMTELDELAIFIHTQKAITGKMMEDNKAVRQRILDIIGE